MSFRSRLRLYFGAVAVGIVVVAAVFLLVAGRRANERSARADAEAAAQLRADAVAEQLEITAATDQPRLRLSARDLARSLSLVDSVLIAVGPQGASDLGVRPGSAQLEMAPLVEPLLDDLRRGTPRTVTSEGTVIAAVPVELGSLTAAQIRAEPVTLVVLVSRELGTVGLGPLAPALLLTAALALIAAFVFSEFLARRLRQPLLAVAETSRRIGEGDLSARADLPPSTDEEIATIGTTIDELAEQLDRERAHRQQFLLDVSHELRTPLTAVRGHAELLRDDGMTTAEAVESAEVIEREALRMERLIGDLIQLAEYDAGQMSVTPAAIDVTGVVDDAMETMTARARSRSIELHRSDVDAVAAVALADRDRLNQVMVNLVSNAIDFASSSVSVQVAVLPEHVVLSVRDDGPGLGPQPEQFFERHRRGAQPTDRTGGLGVGLSIVETFVLAMGGSVSAANLEQGAVLTVTLARA